jgi:hypothetical protein
MSQTKTLPAKLLDLTLEYAEANRVSDWDQQYGKTEGGRTPERIAEEYGETLREFLNT